jgi:hypothetical protein
MEGATVMTTQFPRVNPGDVITATQWNSVLDALEDIYSQIGDSTSQTGVAITGFLPPGPVQVGDALTILGRNFEFSIGAQRIFFGNVQINAFQPGSNDTQLKVLVPTIPGLPDNGQPVTVTAFNRTSNDQRTITVTPIPVPLSGFVDVMPGTTGVVPTGGGPAEYQFTLTSRMNKTATVAITSILDVGWSTQALDQNHVALPAGQLQLVPFQPATIFVRVTGPANVALSTPFTLTVNVDAGGANRGSSGPIAHAVGVPDVAQDPNIVIQQASSPALQGGIVVVAAGSFATLSVPVTFLATGGVNYTVSVSPVGTVAGWQVKLQNPNGTAGTSTQAPFASPPPVGVAQMVQFNIQPQANGAAASGTFELKLQRTDNPALLATRRYPVKLPG